jgi:hypothetical protein
MDPRWLFPLLCVSFLAAALWRGLRSGNWRGAASTWLILSAAFGVVALWLGLRA